MSRMINPDVTEDQIIDAYGRLCSSTKAAKELGVTERRVCLTLRKHKIERNGVEIYRKAAQAYPDSIQSEIVRLHDNGLSHTELYKMFGGSLSSIKMAIIRNGGEVHAGVTSRRTVSDDEGRRICELYQNGLSQDDISDQIGFSQAVVSRILRENGVVMRRGQPTKERHPGWKGGINTHGNGYVLILVDKDDPLAEMRNRSGYIMEHRLVMARHLGRPLSRTETVHHINGNVQNNDISNLQLRQGKHGKHSVLKCRECGSYNIEHEKIAEC